MWGLRDDQSSMQFYGYGFASGPTYRPRELLYVWNDRFETLFFQTHRNLWQSRWEYFDETYVKLLHGAPVNSWADGVEVFTADPLATTVATRDGLTNPRRILISGGFDPQEVKHYTAIHGPEGNYFMRVGDDYCLYYTQKGFYFATQFYNNDNIALYDGRGNDYSNRWVEVAPTQIRLLKAVNVGSLDTTAQDVRGAINELKAGGGSGSTEAKYYISQNRESGGTIASSGTKQMQKMVVRLGSWNMNDGNTGGIQGIRWYKFLSPIATVALSKISSISFTILDNNGKPFFGVMSMNIVSAGEGNGDYSDLWCYHDGTQFVVQRRNGGQYHSNSLFAGPGYDSGDGNGPTRGQIQIEYYL
jgi:hypothetical protein